MSKVPLLSTFLVFVLLLFVLHHYLRPNGVKAETDLFGLRLEIVNTGNREWVIKKVKIRRRPLAVQSSLCCLPCSRQTGTKVNWWENNCATTLMIGAIVSQNNYFSGMKIHTRLFTEHLFATTIVSELLHGPVQPINVRRFTYIRTFIEAPFTGLFSHKFQCHVKTYLRPMLKAHGILSNLHLH